MPAWATSIIAGLLTLVASLVLTRLTTKGAAVVASDIKQLKADSWSVKDKIDLAERLTRIESVLAEVRRDIDFTRTSHTEFLRLLEKALIPTAHSPHTPDLDKLLEKRDRDEELSSAEWRELIRRLGEEAKKASALPGRQVALNGLRAIYLTHLRQAERRERQSVGM